MNKATPIKDSIYRIPNESMENATCLPCGGKISRSISGYTLPWLHAATGRTLCAEERRST